MDYYEILGVHRDASAYAIKSAYRRLAKKYHPDYNPQDAAKAERMTQLLNEAYGVLSKADKRRAYDQVQERGSQRGSPNQDSATRSPAGTTHPTAEPYTGEERRQSSGRRTNDGRRTTDARQPYEHETNDGFSEGERRANAIMKDWLDRPNNKPGNRFESKDAFFAILVCFFMMLKPPADYVFNLGNFMVAWPFFAGAVLAAQAARAAAGRYFALAFRGGRDSLILLLFSNVAAAVALGAMSRVIEAALHHPMFFFPLTPALLAAVIPGTVGAGIGRAFSRSIGMVAGLIGGGVTGLLAAMACVLWAVLVQIAELGGNAGNAGTEVFSKPIAAVLTAGVVAGILGSFRIQGVFIYAILEWMEGLFDRVIPPDPSKALVARD